MAGRGRRPQTARRLRSWRWVSWAPRWLAGLWCPRDGDGERGRMEQGPAAGQQHVPTGSVQDLGGRPCSAASCIPPLPAWGPVVPGGQRQRWPGARAVVWWQREVGDAGTTEAGGGHWSGQSSLFQCGKALLFQLFTLESNDDGKRSVPHSLGEILADLGRAGCSMQGQLPFQRQERRCCCQPCCLCMDGMLTLSPASVSLP